MRIERTINSPEETRQLAAEFSEFLQPGETVAFYGDLGAGKTFFVKALCQVLETDHEATSPTFTIINQYQTAENIPVFHCDFYRLQSMGEVANLGLDEYFYSEAICLVEWADKIEPLLPEEYWRIDIKFVEGAPEKRTIIIQKIGDANDE
ncbi:MAG: tRNA (adenosine(37)-N6)-threonylcarbamoyltransferase complex ATPase subunit type 1 TsaE [Calditrichia bacterium]